MKLKAIASVLVLGGLAPGTLAERSRDQSLCDYYAEAILGENTEANQALLLTLLTNTAVIGNYTTPNKGVSVNGFANDGQFLGQNVSILAYFNGGFASTNTGGSHGTSKLFLDDGGPAPIMKNHSSNGNKSSAQFNLLTHVDQYFGVLLGCSKQGGKVFPAYSGKASMYEVHKYMDISYAENGYLIEQFVLSASSLGFSATDVAVFNTALNYLFQYRCAPAETLIPEKAGKQLQSICIAPDCPLHPRADCAAYPNNGVVVPPKVANRTLIGNAVVKAEEPVPTVTSTGEDKGHVVCVEGRDLADDAASTACASSTVTGSTARSSPTANSGAAVVGGMGEEVMLVVAMLGATLIGVLIV